MFDANRAVIVADMIAAPETMIRPMAMPQESQEAPGFPVNPDIDRLTDYPFARLRALLDPVAPGVTSGAAPGATPVNMSIGEPQHPIPGFALQAMAAAADGWNRYPPIPGSEAFRRAAADWLTRRYGAAGALVDPADGLLALSGTREGLFLVSLAFVPASRDGQRPAVLVPNPFYPAYRGGGLLAHADVVPMPCREEDGFLPDLDRLSPDLLARTAVMFLTHPTNPQGAVTDAGRLAGALRLARRHGFILVVDECYSEIWDAAPPVGALEAAASLAEGAGGSTGGALDNLLVFHSLSKRSNAAGLRAGFVAGDPRLLALLGRVRSYAAAAMPLPVQAAAAALWADDAHVEANRAAYRAKFDAALDALSPHVPVTRPAAGFFLWLDAGDGVRAAEALWREAGVRVLPGGYLALEEERDGARVNPGAPFVRIALVHEPGVIAEALGRAAPILARIRDETGG